MKYLAQGHNAVPPMRLKPATPPSQVKLSTTELIEFDLSLHLCPYHRGSCANIFSVKLRLFSYPSFKTSVLGAQKNRLTATVLLSTHNICLVEKYENSFQLRSHIWGPGPYIMYESSKGSGEAAQMPRLISLNCSQMR